MGVLNVTPDSFSDGGRFLDADVAIDHGRALIAEGADIVDVGGESSRPGADPVDEAEELRRVVPVIEALAGEVRLSIDTVKPAVARAAVAAGATLVNDVSATLAPVAGELGVGYVAMHRRGTPHTMQIDPRYDDVVVEVKAFLAEHAERAAAAGVDRDLGRPGHRLRQDHRAQPQPAAPPRRDRGPGLPGAGRHQSQGLPRAAAGRVRRGGRTGTHR